MMERLVDAIRLMGHELKERTNGEVILSVNKTDEGNEVMVVVPKAGLGRPLVLFYPVTMQLFAPNGSSFYERYTTYANDVSVIKKHAESNDWQSCIQSAYDNAVSPTTVDIPNLWSDLNIPEAKR